MEQLLGNYFREESVEKTCEKCQCKTAGVRHEILTLPKLLVLHMMRFVPNWAKQTYEKCFQKIRISDEVSLDGVCAPVLETRPKSYKLNGFVSHIGLGPGQGHYVADTKEKAGWTRYNDSVASRFDPRELQAESRQKNIYLAVFSLNQKQPSLAPRPPEYRSSSDTHVTAQVRVP